MPTKKTAKLRITNDGVKGFFSRAHGHARKLDSGEELPAEITISFENPGDIVLVLSPQRIRVLEFAKTMPRATTVSALASGLSRDLRAVSRDIELLERFGLLRTRYESNPGHGRRRVVEPRASKYQLVATV